ncbi:UDP-N-acetylglucosamine 2-epimerase (non-hydrolyzing) [Clostridiaceae bacterium]|nr:UDP-N-acetylglucosamine 2-epimerase (non-hydrolyzing) [Clostridiaceae bacterium]
MKVLVVFGTRPEAIKMCPLIIQMKKTQKIECCVCLTGQHREMLQQVMDIFRLQTQYNLDIMKTNQTLSMITISIIERIENIIEFENPDLVLVHGDTSTSFAASLAAFYQSVPVGHVESGLRTYNLKSPFPEEFNRQAVDLISELYFAPTESARQNLLREGKDASKIFVTGNTVIDVFPFTIKSDYQNDLLKWAEGSRMILLTTHRRENIGEPMEHIFHAVKNIIEDFPDVKVIYPIHKNPKVRKIANEIFQNVERIQITEPFDVVAFHNVMSQSYLILTDSGGVQEEAPSLGKPVLVLRNTTERPEGIAAGTSKLTGISETDIYQQIRKLLIDKNAYERMSSAVNPYGDGHASERITEIILQYLLDKEVENAEGVNCPSNI